MAPDSGGPPERGGPAPVPAPPATFEASVEGPAAAEHRIRVERHDETRLHLALDGAAEPVGVEILRLDEAGPGGARRLVFLLDGVRRDAVLTPGADGAIDVLLDGFHGTARVDRAGRRARSGRRKGPAAAGDWRRVAAPMPAVVAETLAEAGAVLAEGQAILRLEAMKVVTTLSAPRPCRLATLEVAANATVASGQILATLEPLEED